MNEITINRKPIFDEVRRLLERGFTQAEVTRIDRAIDRALSVTDPAPAARLGALSEQFESGGRGAGAVSSGSADPGGVSYGIYQLSSAAGTVASFLASEGEAWAGEFGNTVPGSQDFSGIWRVIAEREAGRFGDAQHAFIERTHYRPAVKAVLEATSLDLDSRQQAVRDVTWSVSVQHGGAATILKDAVAKADEKSSREQSDYDRTLIVATYAERTAYVLRVAGRSSAAVGRTLRAVTENRYPAELQAALTMLAENEASA